MGRSQHPVRYTANENRRCYLTAVCVFVRYALAKLKRVLCVFSSSMRCVFDLFVSLSLSLCVCVFVMTRCMIPVWEAEDRDVLAAALESLLGSFCETELFDVVEVRLSLSLSRLFDEYQREK